ncbi:magnesium transporter [Mollicutes bacterium LVI A0078]|nr:magnesium transporter [Mollicutes bacterium LVI A0075]WOO90814.1 magnesium transporter [Mollicutes bacterium LVI A0078]
MKKDQFLELHPKDQALYFLESNRETRKQIINECEAEVLASFFEHFDEEDAAKIFARYDINIIVDIINEMNSDDVTRIFREVDPLTRNRYLSLLDKIHAQQIREILQYEEDTAGGIMEKSFFYLKNKHTVKRAKELLLELAPTIENINYLYVLTPKFELIGVVSLKELLLGDDSLLVTDVMTTDLKTVDVNSDVITAASVVRDYDFYALPVINEYNQMQGLITVDDILDVIADEARENIEQISGVDTEASETHFWGNVGLRLPWLVLLLLMTMFNANVIGRFNGVIEIFPILASYMTLVAAMSGNVGTQTLGLTIYRLSQDEEFDGIGNMLRYAFSEIKVYFVVSICLSILISVVVGILGHNINLAVTLMLTIIITFMISACLGTLIPITLDKLKINSQVASGPLITTVNDLIAVVTFLTLGSFIMQL